MPKEEFIAAVRKEREDLIAALDGFDDEELSTVPICGTWTAKDFLAHLAATDNVVLGVIDQARRGEVLVWGWSAYPNGDDWNQAMTAARRGRSVAEVRAEFEGTTDALLSELESWPEDAGPFGADSWIPEKSPIGWIPDHDREHAAALANLAAVGVKR